MSPPNSAVLTPKHKPGVRVDHDGRVFYVKQIASGVQITERYLVDHGPAAGGTFWHSRAFWHSGRDKQTDLSSLILSKAARHATFQL